MSQVFHFWEVFNNYLPLVNIHQHSLGKLIIIKICLNKTEEPNAYPPYVKF